MTVSDAVIAQAFRELCKKQADNSGANSPDLCWIACRARELDAAKGGEFAGMKVVQDTTLPHDKLRFVSLEDWNRAGEWSGGVSRVYRMIAEGNTHVVCQCDTCKATPPPTDIYRKLREQLATGKYAGMHVDAAVDAVLTDLSATPPAQAAEAVERAMDVADTIINRLEGWDRAYPTDIFREVTDEESKWLHETRPGLIDRISAGMGRHMAGCIREDLATLRAAIAAMQAGGGKIKE